MAEVHRLPTPRREHHADGERSVLRATWHTESGVVVISLWRGDTCVATSHLSPHEAGRLAAFITGGLADIAEEAVFESDRVIAITPRATFRDRLDRGLDTWRKSVATSLEGIARRIR